MKRGVIGVAIVILLIVIAFEGPKQAETMTLERGQHSLLVQAFLDTGTKFAEYNINGWLQVNNQWLDKPELEKIGLDTLEKLGGAKESFRGDFTEDTGFRGYRLSGQLDNNIYLEILVQSMELIKDNNPGETYLVISLTDQGDIGRHDSYRGKAEKALKALGKEPQLASIFTGVVAGNMSLKEQENLIDNVFARVKAEKLEGVSEENLVSWSGYTDQIEESISIGEKKININVASRYHNIDDYTYVIVGSPIISMEY